MTYKTSRRLGNALLVLIPCIVITQRLTGVTTTAEMVTGLFIYFGTFFMCETALGGSKWDK